MNSISSYFVEMAILEMVFKFPGTVKAISDEAALENKKQSYDLT